MTLKWYQRDDNGDIVEMVGRVAVMHSPSRPGTEGLVTNAEEGTVGRSQIQVDDPDGTFSVRGHRRIEAAETAAADDDWFGVVWSGYSTTQTIEEGSPFDGIGRVWTLDLDDLNALFERRIMDSGAIRPAETDVERIQWLLGTPQAEFFADDTYVSTDDPIDMDACDYRGQKLRDVFDDAAQQSGKNWYLIRVSGEATEHTRVISPWYGHGTLDTFVSGVTISNDPADVEADETGLTFGPSAGTTLRRDPSRVFSGVWMEYDGGDVYVTRLSTATAFALGGRDTTSEAMNVKTSAKATARALQYLGSIKTQEDVIETAIVVPAEKVNCVVHGHLIDVKVSWMPDYNVLTTGRVVNRTVRQVGEATYELALEIAVQAPVLSGCAVGGTLVIHTVAVHPNAMYAFYTGPVVGPDNDWTLQESGILAGTDYEYEVTPGECAFMLRGWYNGVDQAQVAFDGITWTPTGGDPVTIPNNGSAGAGFFAYATSEFSAVGGGSVWAFGTYGAQDAPLQFDLPNLIIFTGLP